VPLAIELAQLTLHGLAMPLTLASGRSSMGTGQTPTAGGHQRIAGCEGRDGDPVHEGLLLDNGA
jgi:hypothetical protein